MCALVLLDTCVVVAEILLELNAMRSQSLFTIIHFPTAIGVFPLNCFFVLVLFHLVFFYFDVVW